MKKLAALAALLLATPVSATAADAVCVPAGQWRVPATGAALDSSGAVRTLADKAVVLLGEAHTAKDDHRWQLQMLATLHARNPNMVIGFESFPRRVRPILDRWIRGELSDTTFLDAVDWTTVWDFDPALYLPLFHFARLNHIPMVPMNVERSLIRRIRTEGWDAVPPEQRHGLNPPAAATDAYKKRLAQIFAEHATAKAHGDTPSLPTDDDPAFRRFVEAQITWDRVMADALADALGGDTSTLVVGIVGRGHLEYGDGIPYQLAARGVTNVAVALPWQPGRACADLVKDGQPMADVVFGLSPQPQDKKAPPRRLGVMIEPGDGGLQVRDVVTDSVAADSGLKAGDVIVRAAGGSVTKNAELVAIIKSMAPGTWLPITLKRGNETLDVVAKFPIAP